ncbi:MAG TPA: fibronectin type III domain-containing protein, partial [Blastocatellia bacterium]
MTAVLDGTTIANSMVVKKGLSALSRATAIVRCVVVLFLGLLSPVHAAENVTLAWDAERGVLGYRLHYGTASGNYTQIQDVGDTTMATVSNLTAGQNWFFVVAAYNAGGESPPSNEVSFHATMDAAIQKLLNGNVRLTVTDAVGQTDSVYVSSDLQKWTLLITAANKTGILVVDDPHAQSMDRRFYRLTDSTAVTDPMGFITLTIAGAYGTEARAFSCLGISLMNPVSYQGKITSSGHHSVTDVKASWTADEFNGANGEFFMEIISGPYAGLMTDILATSVTGKTLATFDDLSSLLTGGELYRIRRHRTLGDVFGENNNSGLTGGSSVSAADEIMVLNPITQTFLTFYFKTGGFGGTGWRSATDAVTDASGTTLYPDQGVLIVRKVPGDISLILAGTVKTGPTIVPIGANISMVANIYPAGTMTVANSGLHRADGSLGLAGGETVSSSDEVRIFNGVRFQDLFYKTGGFG